MEKQDIPFFRRPVFWLIIIFLVVLATRLYIALGTEQFNYDAYFSLRQVDSIRSTGFPLYNDPLSYGGKTQLFAPLYYYLLAFFSFIMSTTLAAKIIPNILASLIVVASYYISLKMTKSAKISMTIAFMSGFIPVYFIDINRISVNYLAVLLVFSVIYCMFRINERRYVDYALILMFLLVLTTPLAFVLVLGLLIYLLLLKLENLEIQMKELEIILFFTFLVFWVNLLIYKNAFLGEGLLVIWQNIPVKILSNFFGDIGFLELLITVSLVPLILGVYAFYSTLHKDQNKETILIIAFGTGSFILLWFKLVDIINGIMFLSLTLTILTAYSLKRFSDFIEKSKIRRYGKWLLALMLILFIATAIVPSIMYGINKSKETPTQDDIDVLKWSSTHLQKDATIAATVDEGDLVAYYANRKNIMDVNFLLTPNIDKRLSELDEIYTTSFETKAVEDLNKYKAQYILLTPYAKKYYGIDNITYMQDSKCFRVEYLRNDTTLYLTDCRIKTI